MRGRRQSSRDRRVATVACDALEVLESHRGSLVLVGAQAIDLMVAPHESSRPDGARAANVPEHRDGIARIAPGMEPALIDHSPHTISALDPTDHRILTVSIAGPAALLVSKLIKLQERLAAADRSPRRVHPKDALDVLRLLSLDPRRLLSGFALHQTDGYARSASDEALDFLRADSLARRPRLARLASEGVGEDPVIEARFTALAQDLLTNVKRH